MMVMMMCTRRSGMGEALSAAIIMGAAAVVATIMLSDFSEQAQVTTEDLGSRLDIMREQAIEQLDVTGVEWRPGGNLTFLVANYGDYESNMPFALYVENGMNVTNSDVDYYALNGTVMLTCSGSTPCDLYNTPIQPKDAIRIQLPWPADDALIVITGSGKGMRVGVN